MTWPQFFDGQGWGNKLAVKYGIEAIPRPISSTATASLSAPICGATTLEQAVAKAWPRNSAGAASLRF